MIASCWNWPSLKYEYFVLENTPLDAGGWSPTRGIEASNRSLVPTEESIAFDDYLPALPKDCYFAGVGDECIGEVFVKKDRVPRASIDLQKLKSSKDPRNVKVAELLLGERISSKDPTLKSNPSSPHIGDSNTELSQSSMPSLWSRLVPIVGSIGGGYALFKTFNKLSSGDTDFKNIALAWGAGLAIGLTIGQEALWSTQIEREIQK